MGKVFRKIIKVFVKVVIVLSVLGLVAFGLVKFNVIKLGAKTTSTTQQQRTTMVTKDSISITVSGSGYISSADRVDVAPSVNGTIIKVYFKDKDTVKKGDLLYELDDSDAKLNYEKAKNNLSMNEVSAGDTVKNISSLVIKAPISGVASGVTAKVGDEIGKGSSILTITDTSKLKMTVPFNTSSINEIKAGQKVTVNIQELMQSVEGVVTYKSNEHYASSSGGQVFDVEITITNPGSLKPGMKATASITTSTGEQTGTDLGKMEYVNTTVVKSQIGGTITSLNVRENTSVNAGDVLIQLQNDELDVLKRNNDFKILDAKAQVESAQKQLSYYKVYAAIDGVIVDQTKKVGESIKLGETLGTIIDMDNMEFSVDIDELDIAKIKVGQEVKITADALEDTTKDPIIGEVSKIAYEGTSSNGVSVFPVTIKVKDKKELKLGMNVNAEIQISSKSDILIVPVEAVTKMGNRSMVWVKSNDSSNQNGNSQENGYGGQRRQLSGDQQGNGDMPMPEGGMPPQSSDVQKGSSNSNNDRNRNSTKYDRNSSSSSDSGNNNRMMRRLGSNASYYANARLVEVELGINNDSYIEVVSGLELGDVLVLPPLTTSTGTSSKTQNQGIGMGMGIGGIGGGMSGPPSQGGGQFRSKTGTSQSSSSQRRD